MFNILYYSDYKFLLIFSPVFPVYHTVISLCVFFQSILLKYIVVIWSILVTFLFSSYKLFTTFWNYNFGKVQISKKGKQSYTDPLSFFQCILYHIYYLITWFFTLILYFVRYSYIFINGYIEISWTRAIWEGVYVFFFSFGSGNVFIAKFLCTSMFISLGRIPRSGNTRSKNINILNKYIFSNCFLEKLYIEMLFEISFKGTLEE